MGLVQRYRPGYPPECTANAPYKITSLLANSATMSETHPQREVTTAEQWWSTSRLAGRLEIALCQRIGRQRLDTICGIQGET